ncbi:hypothetical protein BI001_gp040 [Bacillus phage Zuko]|uniref:hypothetical protein n=1 Tax=Bacillus phage Zuko TaxID=1805956 RepID=UPI0007A7730C|nr:hypothetical protein BI001_gp040 [Bacillus phage Zuko]AMW62436.1 hypothetical protein ZUKO_40 [Bacillus phage Zuko]
MEPKLTSLVDESYYVLVLNGAPYGSGRMDYMKELIWDRLLCFPNNNDEFKVLTKEQAKKEFIYV